MVENVKAPTQKIGGDSSVLDDIAAQMAVVSHGVYTESLPVAGKTVAEIRKRYSDRFEIDPDSTAEINGKSVPEDTVLEPGELLLFAKHAGEKGS